MQPVIQQNMSIKEGQISLLKKSLALLLIVGSFFAVRSVFPRQMVYTLAREALKAVASIETRNWSTVEGKHFIVHYQPSGDGEEMARLVLEDSEKIYSKVAEAYKYPGGKKISILVYPTKQALGRAFGWDASESAMGVYWGGVIRVLSPDQWIDNKDKDQLAAVFAANGPMAHEFTHLVVDYRTKGNYTRWLTEGIAQYKEWQVTGFQFNEPGSDLQVKLYPLSSMDEGFDSLQNQSLAYKESLSTVQYIVDRYGEGKINLLLETLGQGQNMDQAFSSVFGVNVSTFEKDWHNWLKK